MSVQNYKTKDFSIMSKEEKKKYAEVWTHYKEEVAAALAAALQMRFGFALDEIDFDADIKKVTEYNDEEFAHSLIDLHEIFKLEINYQTSEAYFMFGSLYDVVLLFSARITDRELGYVSPAPTHDGFGEILEG